MRLTHLVVAGAALLALSAAPAAAQQNRFEPNQTRRTASRVEPGDYKGLFCNDEDWFFVNVPEGKRLEVSARFTHTDGDLELELHDSRGRLLGWSRGSSDEEVLAFATPEAMPAFVRVHNAHNAYDLHIGLVDTAWSAQGGNLQEVNCWGSDWYPIEVEGGKQLRVAVDFVHADGDLDLAVRDEEGNELAASTGNDDGESLTYTADEDRRVLIHVWHVHHSRNTYSMRVAVGEAVPDDMASVLGEDRLQGVGRDQVKLRNGDTLVGDVLDESFRIATAYADVELPTARIAGLGLDARDGIETVITVDNNRFTGFIRKPAVRFAMDDFPEPVAIPRAEILEVVFGQRGNERAELERHQYVILANGDHFSGEVLGAGSWRFDMGFTEVPIRLPETFAVAFEGDGAISLVRPDETTSKGRLELQEVRIRLDIAEGSPEERTFVVHPRDLDTIFCQDGYVPDNVRPSGRGLAWDFEDGLEPWVAQGNWNTNWHHWPRDGVSGEACVRACGPNGGNYGDNANVTLTSPPLSVGHVPSPVLRMQVRTRLERGPDYLVIRASYDGGNTFTELHRMTGDNEWQPVALPLQPGQDEVVVQLGLTSDGSIVNQGVWIDAVEVVDQGAPQPR